MHIEWSILPKEDGGSSQFAGIYVTLNHRGWISMSRMTYQRMGEPAAFLVMFDKTNSRIALKPTGETMKNAYAAGPRGRYGGRIVRAHRLLTEFGIRVPETLEFKDAEIDLDGQLILDLRTATVSARARARPRRMKDEGESVRSTR